MRYLILGVTEARDERGHALPVGGTRLRALLAALALRAGRTVPVAALVDDIWADDPPSDPPAALQALIGRLRRTVGREAIVSAPGGYRLAASRDEVDLGVFERLARQGGDELDAGDPVAAAHTLRGALALWRGPALADLPGLDHGHALRPEAHRLTALERRIEADLRRAPGPADGGSGNRADGTGFCPAILVPELTELIAAHPYDERFRAQLVRALRHEGRQADALAAYEDARRALADGLGADPGPELTALHRDLLNAPGPEAAGPAAWPSRVAGSPHAASPARGAGQGEPFPATPAGGNIRPRLTSFVGREPELRAIRADLGRSRLVTLTGPGGSGKTRLAEESATREASPGVSFDAWIAELAPVEDPAQVPDAVLSALGLRETNLLRDGREGQPPRTDPTALLVEHLAYCTRARPVLLVLDNCEHVIDAAAALAETLLTRCPGLRVLATSREPLGVPGESVRPLGPLPADPAHRLFAERARAVRPGFDPEQEPAHDAEAVAEICRRLDGLPLAIELAAARLRVLSPRQIADRLDDRFRLLTGGSRTVLPRQQTLRAVVDWSWDLLDQRERTALRQISVFAGGWDLPAAQAVIAGSSTRAPAGPAPETADLIGALVDKSLVVAAPTATGEMRYRLLETIQEYASERAAEAPDLLAAAEHAHSAHFLALAEEAEPRLRSGDQLPWIQRLETELDNLRSVLVRLTATGGDEPRAVRLALALAWFWWLRNLRAEGLNWVERIVALGSDPADGSDPRFWPRMHLHLLRFFLAFESRPHDAGLGDDRTQALMARVREAFMSSGPQAARFPGILWPMTSFLSRSPGDIRGLLEAAVRNTCVHGGAWEYGVTLMFRTHMVVDMPGGMPGVDEGLAELRPLSRRVGDRWMRAQVASASAEAGMMRGRHDEARAGFEEALLLAREVGAHAEAPFLLARLAELSYLTGDLEAAAEGLDRSEAEAERYQVHDARAYVRFLRATTALDAGEIAEARRMITQAQGALGQGVPPSHFTAQVEGLAARITARETGPGRGPAAGVRGLTSALCAARDARCAEIVTGHLADGVAALLAKVGRYGEAVRILAAADGWHLNGPRSEAQQAEADEVERLARAELSARRYAAERAAGTASSVEDVIEVLRHVTAELPADQADGTDPAQLPADVADPAGPAAPLRPADPGIPLTGS